MSEEHDQLDGGGPGTELHRRVDRIVAAVVVLSRVTVLIMVALGVVAGVQTRAYTNAPLAAAVYLAAVGYAALLLALVARGGGVPAWALAGDPEGTLTDLSLALVEAGGDSAVAGLRVAYHFAGLPDDLPGEVVQALALAAAEALSNVAAHAAPSGRG